MSQSPLDKFILACTAVADDVMGTDALVINLGAGSTLTVVGVWSQLSGASNAEMGGLMPDVNAKVDIDANDAVTKALVGKTCTGKGESFRITDVMRGEAQTHIYLSSDVKIL